MAALSKTAQINAIAKYALEKYKTTDLKAQQKHIKEIIATITALVKKNKINAKVMLGGSAAKEVFLGDDFDVDIFVIFNFKQYNTKNISILLGKVLQKLKPVTVHGSRDYFQINKRYEIIPVLEIPRGSQPVNVTDASPMHVSWVHKHLRKNKKLAFEIKKAKIFFKASRVYGAESYIKGISGHVTDILVINYGSFINLITAISKWKESTEIDVSKHKGILDKAKITGPLTIIDPIQKNRNASAAVSNKQYDTLKKAAQELLKKPRQELMTIQTIEQEQLCKKYNCVIAAYPLVGKTDIVGAKLLKGYEQIRAGITDFQIIDTAWFWDKKEVAYYCFNLKQKKLPSIIERKGPSSEFPDHLLKFKQLYPNAYYKKKQIYAQVPRTITTINDVIAKIQKDENFIKRVRELKIIIV